MNAVQDINKIPDQNPFASFTEQKNPFINIFQKAGKTQTSLSHPFGEQKTELNNNDEPGETFPAPENPFTRQILESAEDRPAENLQPSSDDRPAKGSFQSTDNLSSEQGFSGTEKVGSNPFFSPLGSNPNGLQTE